MWRSPRHNQVTGICYLLVAALTFLRVGYALVWSTEGSRLWFLESLTGVMFLIASILSLRMRRVV